MKNLRNRLGQLAYRLTSGEIGRTHPWRGADVAVVEVAPPVDPDP